MSDLESPPEITPEITPDAEDGPWAIKKMSARERQMALEAAKRAKVTVGEWLAEAIRAHVESERADSHVFDVFPPKGGELIPHVQSIPPLSVGEIAQTIEIAERIAVLRGRSVPVRLLTSAMRALALRLQASERM